MSTGKRNELYNQGKNMNPDSGNGSIGGRVYTHDNVGRPMGTKKSRVILEMDEELQRELEAIARDNERSVPGELRTMVKQAIAIRNKGRTLSDADISAIAATVAAVQAAMKDGETK